jgi:hypothetical protein
MRCVFPTKLESSAGQRDKETNKRKQKEVKWISILVFSFSLSAPPPRNMLEQLVANSDSIRDFLSAEVLNAVKVSGELEKEVEQLSVVNPRD